MVFRNPCCKQESSPAGIVAAPVPARLNSPPPEVAGALAAFAADSVPPAFPNNDPAPVAPNAGTDPAVVVLAEPPVIEYSPAAFWGAVAGVAGALLAAGAAGVMPAKRPPPVETGPGPVAGAPKPVNEKPPVEAGVVVGVLAPKRPAAEGAAAELGVGVGAGADVAACDWLAGVGSVKLKGVVAAAGAAVDPKLGAAAEALEEGAPKAGVAACAEVWTPPV